MPKTVQVDDPAKPGRETMYRLLQDRAQITLLHDLLRQRSRIRDGLYQLYPIVLIFPGEFREMNRIPFFPILSKECQAWHYCPSAFTTRYAWSCTSALISMLVSPLTRHPS